MLTPVATAILLLTSPSVRADTAWIDTSASVVRWKGTKFGGRGAHAGTVRLASGWVLHDGGRIVGTRARLDMQSIAITDIPLNDPSPRRRLMQHLVGEDFFAVARFPYAEFVLDRAEHRGANVYRFEGRLTLRGVTHPLTFMGTIWSYEPSALHVTARLSLDRMRWGVAFRGSRLTNDLVDDEIELELDITARTPQAPARRRE